MSQAGLECPVCDKTKQPHLIFLQEISKTPTNAGDGSAKTKQSGRPWEGRPPEKWQTVKPAGYLWSAFNNQ
jgi:hypothetical protein